MSSFTWKYEGERLREREREREKKKSSLSRKVFSQLHTPPQPLQNPPSGHLGRWVTPWSAEEMLDGQDQRVAIPAHARTVHKGLLQKRLEEGFCWVVPRVPSTTQSVMGLNWTELFFHQGFVSQKKVSRKTMTVLTRVSTRVTEFRRLFIACCLLCYHRKVKSNKTERNLNECGKDLW